MINKLYGIFRVRFLTDSTYVYFSCISHAPCQALMLLLLTFYTDTSTQKLYSVFCEVFAFYTYIFYLYILLPLLKFVTTTAMEIILFFLTFLNIAFF